MGCVFSGFFKKMLKKPSNDVFLQGFLCFFKFFSVYISCFRVFHVISIQCYIQAGRLVKVHRYLRQLSSKAEDDISEEK